MFDELTVKALYDLNQTDAARFLEGYTFPWEALPHIGEFILEFISGIQASDMAVDYYSPADGVLISRSAVTAPSASITGPCFIGAGTEVRHCAFIRGNAFIGSGAVVGNSTELKNVILFNGVQVPHYNYVGDSILGYKAHMGAGSITSNVKSDKLLVKVHAKDGDIETGLRKFGAMIGDQVEVGCGSVLNPGTVVGRNTNIYPLSSVRGVVAADSIYKKQGEVALKI